MLLLVKHRRHHLNGLIYLCLWSSLMSLFCCSVTVYISEDVDSFGHARHVLFIYYIFTPSFTYNLGGQKMTEAQQNYSGETI